MPSFEVRFNRGRGFLTDWQFAYSPEELLHIHWLSHHPLDDLAERLAFPLYGIEPVVSLPIDADRLHCHEAKLSRSQLEVRWPLQAESYALLTFLATSCS
jgi:hypothetical protein